MEKHNGIDSKFRFVILASKRAKQLLHGDKPKVKTKSRNLIRIAQEEVRLGLVGYEITEPKGEEIRASEDEGFIGEAIGEEEIEEESIPVAKDEGLKDEEKFKDDEEESEIEEEEEETTDDDEETEEEDEREEED